jgi:hypothetical protein
MKHKKTIALDGKKLTVISDEQIIGEDLTESIEKSEIQIIRIKLYTLKENSLMCTRDFLIQDLVDFIPLFWLMEFVADLNVKAGMNVNAKNLFFIDDDRTELDRMKLDSFLKKFPIEKVLLFNMIMRDKIKCRIVRIF